MLKANAKAKASVEEKKGNKIILLTDKNDDDLLMIIFKKKWDQSGELPHGAPQNKGSVVCKRRLSCT